MHVYKDTPADTHCMYVYAPLAPNNMCVIESLCCHFEGRLSPSKSGPTPQQRVLKQAAVCIYRHVLYSAKVNYRADRTITGKHYTYIDLQHYQTKLMSQLGFNRTDCGHVVHDISSD